ncbi:AAA family ATPase [Nitrospira sp. Ecomares 2.1]
MYFNFFGLRTKPFNTTPDPDFLYLSPGHKQALGSLIYGIREKKGFIAVTGQVGLGKTTILRSFLNQNHQANQETVYLLNPNLSFTSLLKTLLRELGHDPIEGDEAEALEQLHFVLIEKYREGRTVVLLIDEAQNMPVDTLEHLRMLSNLETPKDKLIQIVLLGQPELDGLLDRYELRQLRQRIAVRAIIHPLSKRESFEYIQHRLDKAGGEGKSIFTNTALALIVQEAKGIPRRLNIICDNALVTAFGYNKALVTAKIAKEVIDDLTGRPSHSLWNLVPLTGLALILVLALFALLPLTESKFSDIPSIYETGPRDKERENPKQTLVPEQDLVNGGKIIPSSGQTGSTLTERTQALLTESVSEVFENLRNRVDSHSESTTTPPEERTNTNPDNHEDLLLGFSPDNFQEKVPDATEELEVAAVTPETVSPGILLPQDTIFDLPSQEESIAKTEADSQEKGARFIRDETQFIPSAQQALSELLVQEEPIATAAEANRMVEAATLIQDEAETPSENASDNSLVHLRPEPLSERMGKPTIVAQEPIRLPSQDSLTSVPIAQTPMTSQEITNKQSEAEASPSPVTRIVKRGDTLAKLLQSIYGTASPSHVQFVLEHNPHIVSARKMYPGQKIMFPPLENIESNNTVAEAKKSLGAGKDTVLPMSTKIFAHSSLQIKPSEKKVEVNRDLPYAVATVQKGDTLEKLVKVVYGSSHPSYVQRVLEYNPKIRNPKEIFPGQDITFPKIAGEMKTRTTQASQSNSNE